MAKRLPNIAPHQSELSVQDVRSYGTPQGAAMANEEMRRLQLALRQLQDQLDELRAAPEAEAPSDTPDGEGDSITNVEQIINNYTTTLAPDMLAGVVWVNRLPRIAPAPFPPEDAYLYAGLNHTPAGGHYGYYVHATISHNWALEHKDSFVLHLVDQEYQSKDYHIKQVFYPEVEGLDRDRVILHAVYKPEGGTLEFHDGNLLSNLKFFFVLIRKDGPPDVQEAQGLTILVSDSGQRYHWAVANDGISVTNAVASGTVQEVICSRPQRRVLARAGDECGRAGNGANGDPLPDEHGFRERGRNAVEAGSLE